MAVIIGIGTFIVLLLGQSGEVIPAGITTVVIMVTAGIATQRWTVPPLRLLDTAIGIIVGLGCAWIGRRL